jgi:DedD protein
MGWAFWRAGDSKASEAAESEGRGRDDAEPAAELRARTRRRLIGAAALLAAAVIAVPMLLDRAPRPVPENIVIKAVTAPPASPPSNGTSAIDKPPAVPPAPAEPVADAAPAAPAARASRAVPAESAPKAGRPAGPAAEAPEPSPAPAEKFALQVAALSTAAAASTLAARLKSAGFRPYVEAVSTAEGTRHRVRVGPFASRDEAQRAGEKLKAAGFGAALVSG